jgi:hypothetical protein
MKAGSNKEFLCIFWLLSLFFVWPSSAAEFSRLVARVEVIKADRNSQTVDAQLKELVKELSPVLNFTGFSLLKKSEVRLKPEGKGEIILSSNRLLKLQFLGFESNQARLLVKIMEKGRETFRTVLLIVDKGSVLIGGSPHDDGVLLLRIRGEFK